MLKSSEKRLIQHWKKDKNEVKNVSIFSDEPTEIKGNGTRKGKGKLTDKGLAYIVMMLRKGEQKGMNKPGITLKRFVEITGLEPTDKQKEVLGTYTYSLNFQTVKRYGIRFSYGMINKAPAIYFKWASKNDGTKRIYEIDKVEVQKYYDWVDSYIIEYDRKAEAEARLNTERGKKKPDQKVIEQVQAEIMAIVLPGAPEVTVRVIKE